MGVLAADHNQNCDTVIATRVLRLKESGRASWLEERARFPLLHLCLYLEISVFPTLCIYWLYPHGTTTAMEKFLACKKKMDF